MRPKLNLFSLAMDAHLYRLLRGHSDMSSHVLRVPLSLLNVEFISTITKATQVISPDACYLFLTRIHSRLHLRKPHTSVRKL